MKQKYHILSYFNLITSCNKIISYSEYQIEHEIKEITYFRRTTGKWKIYFDTGNLAGKGEYISTEFPKGGTWEFYSKEGIAEVFNCNEPSANSFGTVCADLYGRYEAGIATGFTYTYQ